MMPETNLESVNIDVPKRVASNIKVVLGFLEPGFSPDGVRDGTEIHSSLPRLERSAAFGLQDVLGSPEINGSLNNSVAYAALSAFSQAAVVNRGMPNFHNLLSSGSCRGVFVGPVGRQVALGSRCIWAKSGFAKFQLSPLG